MDMNTLTYFAYGSNMIIGQMDSRCAGCASIGIARLYGHRFIINSRGVATIVPDREKHVHGIAWVISEDDVDSLDYYEGVKGGLYRKVYEQVVLEDDSEPVMALVYVAADSVPGKSRHGYLDGIIEAAELHGFSEEYIKELKGWGDRLSD